MAVSCLSVQVKGHQSTQVLIKIFELKSLNLPEGVIPKGWIKSSLSLVERFHNIRHVFGCVFPVFTRKIVFCNKRPPGRMCRIYNMLYVYIHRYRYLLMLLGLVLHSESGGCFYVLVYQRLFMLNFLILSRKLAPNRKQFGGFQAVCWKLKIATSGSCLGDQNTLSSFTELKQTLTNLLVCLTRKGLWRRHLGRSFSDHHFHQFDQVNHSLSRGHAGRSHPVLTGVQSELSWWTQRPNRAKRRER